MQLLLRQQWHLSIIRLPVLGPIISGILLILSFPKPGLYGLAWVSLIPFLLSITAQKVSGKKAFWMGFVFGMVYFFGTIYWIYHSIHFYGNVPLIPSILAVLLLSAYLSLYPGLFSFLLSFIYTRTFYPLIIIAPSLWVILEYLRTYLLTGFPWSLIGYTQFRVLPVIQIADITGVYGISFLIVAFNACIVDIVLLKKRREEIPFYSLAPQIGGFVFLIIALLSTLAYGYWRLSQQRPGELIRITIVQGNIPQDRKWDPLFQNEVMKTYKELTREAVRLNSPHLVVWPETATPFIFDPDPVSPASYQSIDLMEFTREIQTYLLFGAIRSESVTSPKGGKVTGGSPAFYNSAFLLNKDGKVTYIYDKIHLVPFGEYVPLRRLLFFIDKITVGIGDYRPGEDTKRAVTPFGRFSTLICYEIIFPGLVRASIKDGGDFIVNITNDAWFGKTSGPYQHFSKAVLRAVENRKPIIRAANTGISGFIDSNGRILAETPLFERMAITMDLKTERTATFYTRFGDLFVYICILITIFVLAKVIKI